MAKHSVVWSCLVCLLAIGCDGGNGDDEVSQVPVAIRFSVDPGEVEGLFVELDEGYIVISDVVLYGAPVSEDDPYLTRMARAVVDGLLPAALAHAGHSHGEATFEGELPGTRVIPLSETGVYLGDMTLGVGHYFDGRFALAPLDAGATLAAQPEDPLPDALTGRTFYLRGTVTTADGVRPLELGLPLSATVAGLEIASYVEESGDNTIELQLQLGQLLAGLPASAWGKAGTGVTILSEEDDGFMELKIGLKDRLNYIDAQASN